MTEIIVFVRLHNHDQELIAQGNEKVHSANAANVLLKTNIEYLKFKHAFTQQRTNEQLQAMLLYKD